MVVRARTENKERRTRIGEAKQVQYQQESLVLSMDFIRFKVEQAFLTTIPSTRSRASMSMGPGILRWWVTLRTTDQGLKTID